MKVTFMVKLVIAIVDELRARGCVVWDTDFTEESIKALVFTKMNKKYDISVHLKPLPKVEYLCVFGSSNKDDYYDAERIPELVKQLGGWDRLTISYDLDDYYVNLERRYDFSVPMKNVNRDAVTAIAKDIIGGLSIDD